MQPGPAWASLCTLSDDLVLHIVSLVAQQQHR